VESAVARNAAVVAAVIASEVSVRSRIAAAEQATLPAATAVLSGDSPASTPPLTPSAASAAVLSRSRRKENIQASQLAAHTPSVTASTMPLAPAPRRGSASGMVTSMPIRMTNRVSTTGGGVSCGCAGAQRSASERSTTLT
jgi:hypothetical protein